MVSRNQFIHNELIHSITFLEIFVNAGLVTQKNIFFV